MTYKEFFNRVKGRKIRYHHWKKGMYFIPESIKTNPELENTEVSRENRVKMYGKFFQDDRVTSYTESWYVNNGLKSGWLFVDSAFCPSNIPKEYKDIF